MSATPREELIAWAHAQLPRLTDEAYRATRERVPLYDVGEAVSHEELQRSIERNLHFLLDGMAHGSRAADLAAPEETGRRRARAGVPLPEVLRAYRISFGTLWDALETFARGTGSAAHVDALLAIASQIWLLSDVHAVALTEAYRATTADLLLTEQRRRSAVVEALLTGQLGPEAATAEAAILLGLPPQSPLVVVAAQTHELAREGLRDIERLLAGHGVVSAWRLTPALQMGVIALGAHPVTAVLEVLEGQATARVGVSPTFFRLADTPRALRLARAALTASGPEDSRVRVFASSPIAALVVAAPEEAARLTETVLGPVLALPPADRDVLLNTLHAYLDASGSAERAGKELHCHPNTVRYRLRRVQELTGRSLSDVDDLAELSAAAYAVRSLGPQPETS